MERIVRDLGLASIWTDTNEVMNMIVATEWYKELAEEQATRRTRDCELDAQCAGDAEEKVYE